MRILTGKYKGRNITMPKGIWPTQNVVRKAIFDIIQDIEGLTFLELFAGSGAVGFEALSRGVSGLVMVEENRDCQLAIKKNIETLKADNCLLYPQEVQRAILVLAKSGKKFDIVFLDPPYDKNFIPRRQSSCQEAGSALAETPESASLAKKTLHTLGAYDIVALHGFVIIQHFKGDLLPKEAGSLVLIKEAGYGDTVLSFYRKVN